MKIFALFVILPLMILMVVAPCVDTYKKHKSETSFKRFLYALTPLLFYIVMVIAGFIVFEFIPRIAGPILDNIFG